MKICFATNNPNKLREVRALLGNEFELVSLEDIGCVEDIPETADTIEGNSRLKAAYVSEHYHIPCFADDTGLEVKALGGDPGVFSARYAGNRDSEANMNLLLHNLTEIIDRTAQFKTVITLIIGEKSWQFTGIIKGVIGNEPTGNEGFGYDPIFIPDGYKLTFAQMSANEKNAISHRALAVNQLISHLKNELNQ